jgi:hypothetical protein
MTLTDDHTINEIVQSTDWPTDNEGAEIVVCENDLNAEPQWIVHLQKQYPGKRINVLNNFRNRSLEDVRKHFESAEYITFSTTFTSTDWFELLLDGLKGMSNKFLYCFSHNKNAWTVIGGLFDKEIEALLDNKIAIIVPENLDEIV